MIKNTSNLHLVQAPSIHDSIQKEDLTPIIMGDFEGMVRTKLLPHLAL